MINQCSQEPDEYKVKFYKVALCTATLTRVLLIQIFQLVQIYLIILVDVKNY